MFPVSLSIHADEVKKLNTPLSTSPSNSFKINKTQSKFFLTRVKEIQGNNSSFPVIDPSSGALITKAIYSSKPNHSLKCPKEFYFDVQTKYCVNDEFVLGPFPNQLKKNCIAEMQALFPKNTFEKHSRKSNAKLCYQNKWSREFLLSLQDKYDFHNASLNEVIQAIKNNPEVYKIPNEQDIEGRGIYPEDASTMDGRSEEIYPPYILSPRRQTDSLVRQLYYLLPDSTKEEIAFVIADRLIQNPEAYIPYLKSRKKIVIVGSFMGIHSLSSRDDEQIAIILHRHEREFFKLKASIALAKAMNLQIVDVIYGMGDSADSLARELKEYTQARFNQILFSHGIQTKSLTWGADELIPIALAKYLPSQKAYIKISNPQAPQFFESMAHANLLAEQRLKELNLEQVAERRKADILVYVFTRRPNGLVDEYIEDDKEQESLDKAFAAEINKLQEAEKRKLVVIDARLFNGAWDTKAIPEDCNFLAFGSWGTFSNNIGTTLATAKILNNAQMIGKSQSKAYKWREKLLLESIYHDVFVNGYSEMHYAEAQNLLKPLGIEFKHFEGYESPEETAKVFALINKRANEKMQHYFRGTQCMKGKLVRATPQFWRTFESEVHLISDLASNVQDDIPLITGIYRKDLPSEYFSPLHKAITAEK